MKINKQRTVALGTFGVLTAATLGGSMVTPAHAKKSSTWKAATIVGGVATGYGLLKKKPAVAIVGGLGTAYAYSQSRKYSKREKAEEARRVQWYKNRYGRNWRTYYKPGT